MSVEEEMHTKELVDVINSMNTTLVKVVFGYSGRDEMVFARPAHYNDRDMTAVLYRYIGPLDPERWVDERAVNRGVEKVIKRTFYENGAIYSAVLPFPTVLDTLPLRDLPLWAKELWIEQKEMSVPSSGRELERDAMMMNAMRKLIDEERGSGGLNPDDMNEDMRGRLLKLWYSLDALNGMAGRGMKVDDLNKLEHHLEEVKEVVPHIRELPWRRERGLDPGSWFNREDVIESILDILDDVMTFLLRTVGRLIREREGEGGG